MINTVLFDLDGVVRHFGMDDVAEIEQRHLLGEGVLSRAAFSPALLTAVTTGAITRDEWVRAIGERVGNAAAASEWSSLTPTVDAEVLDLADGLRDQGLTTAVLTNGTNTTAAEVAACGIDQHFDTIFNSADIGYVKPDVRAFSHVLRALERAPAEVFVIDDTESKLDGARTLGMATHLFTGITELRNALRMAGIEIHPCWQPRETARRTAAQPVRGCSRE